MDKTQKPSNSKDYAITIQYTFSLKLSDLSIKKIISYAQIAWETLESWSVSQRFKFKSNKIMMQYTIHIN
jgi:hypothetical protein